MIFKIFESKIKRKGYHIVGEWTLGQPHKSARSSSSCQKQQAPCLFVFRIFFENRFSSKLRTWMNEWMNELIRKTLFFKVNQFQMRSMKFNKFMSIQSFELIGIFEEEEKKSLIDWLSWKFWVANSFGHLFWSSTEFFFSSIKSLIISIWFLSFVNSNWYFGMIRIILLIITNSLYQSKFLEFFFCQSFFFFSFSFYFSRVFFFFPKSFFFSQTNPASKSQDLATFSW